MHNTTRHRSSAFGRLCLGVLTALLATGGVWAADVQAATATRFQVVKADKDHIDLLRRGGLVVYMRHGATDAHFPDQIPVRLDHCASQRPLTDAGRAQLDQIGRFVRSVRVPYTTVISSPFCRAQESAERVFGKPIEVDPMLRYTATMPTSEKKPAIARTKHWLSEKVPQAGTNRVVVAHGPNIAELMDYLPPEAALIIFRPLGSAAQPSFEYLASIEPQHWPALLTQLGAP
ncbi:MAG: histidine phosphatase family protein [Burkholderiaceae bacterium]|nr:histidine phosphatase family protein [Burkholderiaceae bacterium]